MSVFENPFYDDHALVVFARDAEAGLRGVLAIHDAGPMGLAGGGLRMHPYPDEAAAVTDVLRLSRAMSYKLALADLPAGGAKMVILGDPHRDKTPALLRAVGDAVEALKGKFIAGTDVGTSDADLDVIKERTVYVNRQPEGRDTGRTTAHGVYAAIGWAAKRALGRDSLDGVRVTIQGLGHVGSVLAKLLADDGAALVVGDTDSARAERIAGATGAEGAPPDALLGREADVFAPCAMADVLSERTVGDLRCRIVAGAANNPLPDAAVAERLADREILYVPDFVANLGGVLGAAPDASSSDEDHARRPEAKVREVLDAVAALADEESLSPNAAAIALAKQKLDARRT